MFFEVVLMRVLPLLSATDQGLATETWRNPLHSVVLLNSCYLVVDGPLLDDNRLDILFFSSPSELKKGFQQTIPNLLPSSASVVEAMRPAPIDQICFDSSDTNSPSSLASPVTYTED